MTARCGSCQAPIEWATTHAGRHMPLDAQRAQEPTSLIAWRDPSGDLQVRDIDGIGASEAPRYALHATSHFATCPNASAHRKKRSRDKPECRVVEVDGQAVLVRGAGTPTQEDLDALTEVVQAAKRKHESEHPS